MPKQGVRRCLALLEQSESSSFQVSPSRLAPIHLALGVIYWDWNQIDSANYHMEMAYHLLDEQTSWEWLEVTQSLYALSLATLCSEHERAMAIMEQAKATTIPGRPSFLTPPHLFEVVLYLVTGDLDPLYRWASRVQLSAEDEITASTELALQLYACYLFLEQRLDEAEALQRRLVAFTERYHRVYSQVHQLLQLAAILEAKGQHEEAIETLSCAMTVAAPGQFVRPFIDQAAFLATVYIACFSRFHFQQEWSCRRFFRGVLNGLASVGLTIPTPTEEETIHPLRLSPREAEVLAHVAIGQTNKAIARQLEVTAETIKKHLKNIFLKLEVATRTEAVSVARRLGEISELQGSQAEDPSNP